MKLLIYFALILAFQLNGSFAYANSPLEYAYVIKSPNGRKSRILGTIHAGIKLQDMPPEIMEIIASAKRLVVESNEETSLHAIQLLLEKESEIGFSSENLDSHLSKLIDREDIDWRGITPPGVDKSTFISSSLKSPVSVSILLTSLTCLTLMKEAQQTTTLDQEIVNAFQAINDGVIHYLDSLEILTQVYEKVFNPQLNSVILDNYQNIIKISQREAQYYRRGKELPESIEAYFTQIQRTSFAGMMDPEVISYLGSFRNHQWLSILREQINKGDAFIAFGLTHLIGKDGILNLLRQDGYEVTPLKQ